jgi:type II secretory pathway pseudopilin PulG
MLHKKTQPNKNLNMIGGFGLLELMVSIGIVVLVMGIIVSKHSSYNSAVLLRSQAYSVALQAREIQLSAVSATELIGNYRNVLGLHFNTATPAFYYNFRDNDSDNYFDLNEVFGRRNNIDSRFEISAIRLSDGSTRPEISVIFERPNFDARFYTALGPVAASINTVEIDIRVKGTSGTGVGEVRTVEITRTGQITVKNI